MTINKSLSRMPSLDGDGETTSFDFTFRILDAEQLLVITRDQDGVETVHTDYSVSGVGSDTGGSITFSSAPGAADTIHIILNPKFTQEVPFQAEEYEKAFDRQTQQNIRVNDKVNRALKVSETSEISSEGLTLRPVPGAMLIWDENNSIDSQLVADLGSVATVQEPLVLEDNELRLNSDIPKNKHDATSAPTVNHDETQGYSVGSEYTDVTNQHLYVCLGAGAGVAQWRKISGALAALDTVGTDQIEDNAVTLAKLEDGTTGDILYYGASGEPFRLAKGTDDQILKLVSGLPSWSTNVNGALMHVTEEQGSNVAPAPLTANQYKPRDLNTIVTNEIGGSVSNKRVSIPAGTYWFEGVGSQYSGNAARVQLFNYTDSLIVRTGVLGYSNPTYGGSSNPTVRGKFTITDTKEFELLQRSTSTNAGVSAVHGIAEVYAELIFWRIA